MAVQQLLMMGTSAVSRTTISGELWTMGRNETGQLGHGDTTVRNSVPAQVGSLTDWQNTNYGSSPSWHTVVKSDGTLWAWGFNTQGQLGLGDTTVRSSPVQIGSGTDWAKTTNNAVASYAIKTDGTAWSWGQNYGGALGQGDYTDRSSPVQIGSDTDWAHLVTGWARTCFGLKTGGTLYMWGKTATGDVTDPTQVGSDSDWTDMVAQGDGGNGFLLYAIKEA